MIKSYISNALRNILKHKEFSSINVAGLAVGLTAGLYIMCYVQSEHSYDSFHSDSNQIYRITTARVKEGIETTQFASTYAGAGPAFANEFPEVDSYSRMYRRWRGGIVSYQETRFREQDIWHVDSGFFKVFSFPVIEGNANDLQSPGIAFIEESTAQKYFGRESPIGKRIAFGSVDGMEEYEIRGVLKCPQNSSIKFTFIFSYHDLGRIFGTDHISNWTWLDFHTFLKLKDGTTIKGIEARIPDLLKKYRGDRAPNSRLKLQHFPSIYLQSDTEFETGVTGDSTIVQILLILGFIIILIVWLNYVNLSTSNALNRAKEIGIRKALGSTKGNIILQFLTETMLTNLIAIVFSMILLWLFIPIGNRITGKTVTVDNVVLQNVWIYALLFFMSGTLVMGLYPALQLSSFKPVQVLKGFLSPRGHGSFLRESFVGFQAFISFSMIASILIIIDQIRVVNRQDLGIEIERTLVVKTPEVVTGVEGYFASLDSYKNELLSQSGILRATTSVDCPGADVAWIGSVRKIGANPNESVSIYRSIIDESFIETLGITVAAGKNFSSGQSRYDVLLNQEAVALMGFDTDELVIGQRLILGVDTCTVIGVVSNFHQVSPKKAIAPTVFHYNLETPRFFIIKFAPGAQENIVAVAKGIFQQRFHNEPFDYFFLDEFFDRQYSSERRLISIISLFCVLAVLVSSLGLLGLTWFRIARQRKELAIRKVIGSSMGQLYISASRKLIRTIIVGCLIGVPFTWYVMQRWLEGFAYHTYPKFWEFGVAIGCSIIVALLTISGYTFKIIKSNPVHHLRQE